MRKVKSYSLDTVSKAAESLRSLHIPDNQADDIAIALCKRYGDEAAGMIVDDPYLATRYGISYVQVERAVQEQVEAGKWVYRNKITQGDRRRTGALARAAYRRRTIESGSTICSLTDLIETAWDLERWAGVYDTKTAPLLMANEIYHMSRVIDDNGETLLVMDDLAEAEATIARRVKDLKKTKTGIVATEAMIDQAERELGITYDAQQREAFAMLQHGLGILTGGPGTGKTTTLRGMLLVWRAATDRPIKLCAPSNTAKARLAEACGLDAETIHTMLGIKPFIEKSKDRATLDLPERCLVVCDEFSMVGTNIAATLLSSVAQAHGSLLLVGDEDQLESVEPGSVLRDLIAWGKIPMVRLRTVHRQAGDASVIPANAQKVLAGDKALEIDRRRFVVYRQDDNDALLDDVVTWYTIARDDKACGLGPLDIRIFSPVRKKDYTSSIVRINQKIHDHYHADDPEAYHSNGYRISAGEPVIVVENCGDLDLYNGDLGVAIRTCPDAMIIRIGGREVTITRDDVAVELAYATTVHKAQGGECKIALVVLGREIRQMITRRLLYVGISRATHKLAILAQNGVLESAIDNKMDRPRKTGLVSKLKGGR